MDLTINVVNHDGVATGVSSVTIDGMEVASASDAKRGALVPVEALVTHRTTLDTVPVDLARWATEKSGLIKAIVRIA